MFINERFSRELPGVGLDYIGREEAASPATGSHQVHTREQEEIIHAALAGDGSAARSASAARNGARSRNGKAKASEKRAADATRAAPARGRR